MKSIKPGRGPSTMRAISSIVAVIFGIFWTVSSSEMGAPSMFQIFGILFIGLGIIQAIYYFKNATGENRYSVFDITEEGEEVDPLNEIINKKDSNSTPENSELKYCPYCGKAIDGDYKYCPSCGKKLP